MNFLDFLELIPILLVFICQLYLAWRINKILLIFTILFQVYGMAHIIHCKYNINHLERQLITNKTKGN